MLEHWTKQDLPEFCVKYLWYGRLILMEMASDVDVCVAIAMYQIRRLNYYWTTCYSIRFRFPAYKLKITDSWALGGCTASYKIQRVWNIYIKFYHLIFESKSLFRDKLLGVWSLYLSKNNQLYYVFLSSNYFNHRAGATPWRGLFERSGPKYFALNVFLFLIQSKSLSNH